MSGLSLVLDSTYTRKQEFSDRTSPPKARRLNLPVFELFEKTMGDQPPSTPSRQPIKASVVSLFQQNAIRISEELEITLDGQKVLLTSTGMKGDYHSLYALEGRTEYLKLLHRDKLKSPRAVRIMVDNILSQYAKLSAAGLAIVAITNASTARDDGYMLVEPLQPFKLKWDKTTPESEIDHHDLDQLKTFFKHAFETDSELPLDLKPANFGIRGDNTLVLLDLREEKEDEGFLLVASQALRSIVKGNPYVLEELLALIPKDRLERYKYVCSSIREEVRPKP